MKIYSIQFLRGIAALLVVYTHSINLQSDFGVSAQQFFFNLRFFGCIGVDIFFVISGFIIFYVSDSYSGARQGFLFLRKRFFRINPIYYIASLIFLGCFLLVKFFDNSISTISTREKLNSLVETILIVPTSGNPARYDPILVVGWTLSFEWLFYTLFFISILIKVKSKIFFISLLIVSLVLIGYFIRLEDFKYLFLTNAIMFEFLLGAFVYLIYKKSNIIPISISVAWLLAGIIGYAILIIFGYGGAWNYAMVCLNILSFIRVIIWGIPSAFIVAGCILLEKNYKLLTLWRNEWFNLLGEASFSIYLIHPVVFLVFGFFYKKHGLFTNPDLAVFLQLITGALIGIGFYKLVENPIIKKVNDLFPKNRKEIDVNNAVLTTS